jgi:hypothetical protein
MWQRRLLASWCIEGRERKEEAGTRYNPPFPTPFSQVSPPKFPSPHNNAST